MLCVPLVPRFRTEVMASGCVATEVRVCVLVTTTIVVDVAGSAVTVAVCVSVKVLVRQAVSQSLSPQNRAETRLAAITGCWETHGASEKAVSSTVVVEVTRTTCASTQLRRASEARSSTPATCNAWAQGLRWHVWRTHGFAAARPAVARSVARMAGQRIVERGDERGCLTVAFGRKTYVCVLVWVHLPKQLPPQKGEEPSL